MYHATRLPLAWQLRYNLIVCLQEGTKTVVFKHNILDVLIHAFSKLSQRLKWINPVFFFFFFFEKDLPLKPGYKKKLKGSEKEQSVYGNEIEDIITFKVIFLKASKFNYILRCLKSKTRPLDFVLEVITKDTNFNSSHSCCKMLTSLKHGILKYI